MRIIKPLQAGDKVFDVYELTVGELRAWLAELETAPPASDTLQRLLFEDMEVGDLCRFSSLKPDEIDEMTPSELNKLRESVREVNRDFFALLGRVTRRAQETATN